MDKRVNITGTMLSPGRSEGAQEMDSFSFVGKSIPRVDVADKVAGRVKYTNDLSLPGMLHAKLHTSPYAHARIKHIDLSVAERCEGVRAVLTGDAFPRPVGPLLADRPPLAVGKVRYHGERSCLR